MKSTIAVIAGLAAMGNAHATWQQLWKNGEDLESTCARLPSTNSPIEDYTSTALQCNVKPAAAAGKCDFEAGDTVTIEMHQQTSSRDCKEQGIGGAHWGPVLAYMSKVEDAAAADGSSEFFKVYENAWKKAPGSSQGDNDFWGTKDLNYNCGKLDFKIPEGLPSGDYLLRAEAIALHAASNAGGAQHYVTCYQLTVKGSGSSVPKGVTFPEAYSKTGPGLGFSIHQDMTEYPVPGPELIAGGTSSAPQLLDFGKITGAPAAGAPAPAKSSTAVVAPSAAPKTSAAAATSAAATSAVEAKPTSAAPKPTEAAPKPSAAPAPSADKEFTLAEFTAWLAAQPGADKEYTMQEFIAWLEKAEAGSEAPAASEVAAEPTAAPTKQPSTTLATSVRPAPSTGAGNNDVEAKEYAQCGGQGFTGPKACAAGLTCKEQNPYYSQCIKGNQPDAAPTTAAAKPTKVPTEAPSATKPAITKEAVTKTASGSATPTGSADKEYTLEEFISFLEEAEKSS